MNHLFVKFIGKEYSIPRDLLTYIDLLSITEEVKANIFLDFLRKLSNAQTPCIDDNQMRNVIERQVSKFISMLTEKGIYDRTVNDYIRDNEGYKLISKVNAGALEEAKRVLRQQMSDWIEGYEDAIQKKDSSVTGLGFSIWSGSFVNHAIYAAMEASKVNEQEKAAAKAYQKDMAELDARIESRKNADEKRYIANTYKPHMETAITVFAYELLDTFISDLIKYGKLDKSILNYTHIDRSNDLLKNLGLSQNKEVVLHKAFEVCPFNVAVYMNTMSCDLLDYESFQTAKIFKQDGHIISSLEKKINDSPNANKKRLHFRSAELLSLYTDTPLKNITAYIADFVVKTYSETVSLLSQPDLCNKVIKQATERDILQGDNISNEKATWLVDPIAPPILWERLTLHYGHDDLFDRIKALSPKFRDFNDKTELDTYLKEQLYQVLEKSRKTLEEQITGKREAEEAENKRLIKKCTSIHRICNILLPILIIFPLLLRFILVGVWCSDVKSFVNDYAETQLEKELVKSDSYATKMGLTGEFEITGFEYYKAEYTKSITIVPHITVYSSLCNNFYSSYGDLVFRYLQFEETKEIARPWYIANDEYNPSINFHITVIGADGSEEECYENYEEDDTRFFVYLPFGTIIIFAVYSAVIVIGIKKIKKKYTVENLKKSKQTYKV